MDEEKKGKERNGDRERETEKEWKEDRQLLFEVGRHIVKDQDS